MNKTTRAVLAAISITCLTTAARAGNDESAAAFFQNDIEYWQKGLKVPQGEAPTPVHRTQAAPQERTVATRQNKTTARQERTVVVRQDQQAVIDALAKATRAKLGERYVDDVLRLAKLESGYRCHVRGPGTKVGRAVGPLQVMPGSAAALGVSKKELHSSCEAQIEAGLRHVEKCISVGATTFPALAACHVSGWHGWNRRLSAKHERYKQKYVRMAAAVPSQRRLPRS